MVGNEIGKHKELETRSTASIRRMGLGGMAKLRQGGLFPHFPASVSGQSTVSSYLANQSWHTTL